MGLDGYKCGGLACALAAAEPVAKRFTASDGGQVIADALIVLLQATLDKQQIARLMLCKSQLQLLERMQLVLPEVCRAWGDRSLDVLY